MNLVVTECHIHTLLCLGLECPDNQPQKKVSTTSLASVTSLASLAPSDCESDYGDGGIGRLALTNIVEGVAYLLMPTVSFFLLYYKMF